MVNLEQKILTGVDAILGEGGFAATRSKDFSYSKQQHAYARLAGQGYARFDIATGRTAINMLQAATGTGKTLGYLVPLMLFAAYSHRRVRVAVSTYTRQLQKQISNKDAELAAGCVQQLTGQRLTVRVRLGMGNFVSAVRAARQRELLLEENETRFGEAIQFLDSLIDWIGYEDHGMLRNSGLLYDFIEQSGYSDLPEGIVIERITLNRNCPENEMLAYQTMVEATKSADVLIVNHALLVLNAYRWCSLLDSLEGDDQRRIAVLVCDEADRLPDAAESVIGGDIALHNLLSACEDSGLPNVKEASQKLFDFVKDMKIPSRDAMAIKDRTELCLNIDKTLTVLRPAAEATAALLIKRGQNSVDQTHLKKQEQLAEFVDKVNDLQAVVNAIREHENAAVISWSPIRAYPSLRIGKADPGRILGRMWNSQSKVRYEELFNLPRRAYLDAVLFTSATLETPGRDLPKAFDEFADTIGVIRHPKRGDEGGTSIHNVCDDLFARFEPSKFGQISFVLADPRVPNPTLKDINAEIFGSNPTWLDYAAMMIRTAKMAGGRTLVLVLSWNDTFELEKRLKGLPNLLVHQKGRPLQEYKEQYVATSGAVLISPSAWEGVDLPGLVNHLVITRIPYVPPDTSLAQIKRLTFEKMGYSNDKIERILSNIAESATRRKLAQGIGRGLRRKEDSVTLWIADPRFPMPEGFSESLSPIIMSGLNHRSRPILRNCIPARFLDTTYREASICLLNGKLYKPSN